MRGIPGALPLFLALALALAGAWGLAPASGGGAAEVLDLVDGSPSCEPPARLPEGAVTFDDSDLAAAMRRGAAGGAGRLRLWTDGVDARSAEPDVPGVPVDVVLLPRRDDVALLALRAPGRIPAGADFAVEITVGRTAGPPAAPVEATVELLRDGERVGAAPRRVVLGRGQRRTLRVRDRVDGAGLVRYRAVLHAPLGPPENDRLDAVARAGDRPFVLAVGRPGELAGLEVRSVSSAEAARLLADAEGRAAVDAILLGGPPSVAAQRSIAAAVADGAGLVVLGGRGYAGRPLDEVLPLTDAPPGGRALLLLLDYSGSMAQKREELIRGVDRLKDLLAPGDRIAHIVFTDRVLESSAWTEARDARWDLRAIRPGGNTLLLPALRAGLQRLAEQAGARRRLFVVSDGEWGDDPEELGKALGEMRDVHVAALFVGKPREAWPLALFPEHFRAGDDLGAALGRLEEEAPDRRVEGPVDAVRGAAPAWLESALPEGGVFRAIERLYGRDRGAIPLRAGEVPLVGAWEPGGRVVVLAPDLAANPALARALPGVVGAVARPLPRVRLSAWREDGALLLEAAGGPVTSFAVGDVRVPAAPAGPDRWRGRLEPAPPGELRIRAGGTVLLLAAAVPELAGLHARADVAASIARRTGGSVFEGEAPAVPARGRAVYVTLLGAAVLVLLGAAVRRRP